MHKCLNCGTEFEGKICPECGMKFKENKTCPKCGTNLSGGAKFCNNCGYSFLPETQPASEQQATPSVNNYGHKNSKILDILPMILSVLFAILLFALYAAPVVSAKVGVSGVTVSASVSIYKALGNNTVLFVHGLRSLIAFAAIAAAFAFIDVVFHFKHIDTKFVDLVIAAVYLGVIISASAVIGIINDEYGVLGLSSGGGVIAVLIIACLFLVIYAGSLILKKDFKMPEKTNTANNNKLNYKVINGNIYSVDGTRLIQYGTKKKESCFIVPNNVTDIAQCAFNGCTSLTGVTISNGVKTIGGYAFRSCTSLKIIAISKSVTSIGNWAFDYCGSLTDINYGGTKVQWKLIGNQTHWNNNTGNYIVHCTDGDLDKYGNEV